MKVILGIYLFLMCTFTLNSNTFFLYTEELCDGNLVLLDESVREGILESIFDAGFIIFDDISMQNSEVTILLDQAFGYGAAYLIVVKIESYQTLNHEKLEKIESIAEYMLYNTKTKNLITKGMLQQENKKPLLSRTVFWYNLGISIGKEIEQFYSNQL